MLIVCNVYFITETEEQQCLRFQIELEFIQCLANPNYLNFLAQRNYLKDKAFISYLKYLQYWKRPEYAKYIKYPMCLYFLELLQYEHFRREITSAQCAKFIDDQQILHWQHYTRKRTRFLQPQPEAAAVTAAVQPSQKP
ncbi:mediator of RNA polymerase II transcription subunit 31-like [Stegodyphus dumicola]|uniref:mediator of RNA polymerase II transcription subunit 31-like n=1 Tax=Stegodyphus dumicola TaxID=202533 RepID=UPI0015B24FF7|nr:mediator of RNA polymerase II transcription subunit 31-like [Stegodyphus dumicola]